jgi:hypothetical protein
VGVHHGKGAEKEIGSFLRKVCELKITYVGTGAISIL